MHLVASYHTSYYPAFCFVISLRSRLFSDRRTSFVAFKGKGLKILEQSVAHISFSKKRLAVDEKIQFPVETSRPQSRQIDINRETGMHDRYLQSW